MNTSTTTPNVRLTITVSPEVHQTFQRLAKAGNMPTGRAMGEWLADTIDAAEQIAKTMERARSAPKIVARELHAYALGLGDETGELLKRVREKGRADRSAETESAGRSGGRAAPTPPSNTGVTTTKNKTNRGTK